MKRQSKVKSDPAAKAMLLRRKDHRHEDAKKAATKKACRGQAAADAIRSDDPPLTPAQMLGWIVSYSDADGVFHVERDDEMGFYDDDDEAIDAARKLGFLVSPDARITGWKCPHCGNDRLQYVERVASWRVLHFDPAGAGGASAGRPSYADDSDEEHLECSSCFFRFPVPSGLITEW